MKKLLIILLSALSLTAVAQQKSVAVLDPICRDNSVKPFYRLLIRGEMESAVAATDEYISYDRTAFDKILEEQKFQRSGAVDDRQIKRLGELAGVDFVLITEVSAEEGYITCIAKILNVETGHSTRSYNELMELNAPSVKNGCKTLSAKLFGFVDMNSGQRKGELFFESGRYVGEIVDGLPHGKGIFYYSDSTSGVYSYEGAWEKGSLHGKGTMVWNDGSKVIGEWIHGNCTGKATCIYSNGNRYEGQFENYERHGEGTYYYSDGRKYIGNWVHEKMSGQGTFYWPDGDKYEGHFENDMFSGQGTYYFADGRKYIGNWKEDMKSGQGTFYWPYGDKYVGNWTHGNMSGQGTYYWSDGRKYVGNFENGLKSGRGTYYFSGGYRIGTWKNDKSNGEFTIYWDDGDKDYGNYTDGEPDGEWTRITSKGKRLKAKYENGKKIRDWH